MVRQSALAGDTVAIPIEPVGIARWAAGGFVEILRIPLPREVTTIRLGAEWVTS